tara:strand:+ start:795 stop:1013 length:219 start_codon:yes stop_codon:yes gene_type:complete
MKSIVHIPESSKEEYYVGFVNALISIEHLIDEFKEQNPDYSEWSDVDEIMYSQLIQSQGTLSNVVQQIEKVS